MKFFAPTFRSRRYGHRMLSAGVIVKVGLFTWLTPALVGALCLAITVPFAPATDFDSPWSFIGAMAGFLLFSPIYGIMLVPLGLLVGAWAMRFGVAGWASAVCFALGIPLGFGALFQLVNPSTEGLGMGLIMAPVVLVHALAMWIATRYVCPQALFPAPPEQAAP